MTKMPSVLMPETVLKSAKTVRRLRMHWKMTSKSVKMEKLAQMAKSLSMVKTASRLLSRVRMAKSEFKDQKVMMVSQIVLLFPVKTVQLEQLAKMVALLY